MSEQDFMRELLQDIKHMYGICVPEQEGHIAGTEDLSKYDLAKGEIHG